MISVFDKLPNGLGERAKQLIAEREAQGFNVHFVNSSGKRDRHSFATAERANSFRNKLARMGLKEN